MPAARIPYFQQAFQHQLKRFCVSDLGAIQCLHGLLKGVQKTCKTFRVHRLVGQAAMGDLLQQAACGVLLVAEKPRVYQSQAQQGWFQASHHLRNRFQQTLVLSDVVNHQHHHLQAQGLPEPIGLLAHPSAHAVTGRSAGRVVTRFQALPMLDPLHHLIDLLHLLERFKRSGYRGMEIRGRC